MPGVVGRFNYTIADAGTGEVIYRVWDGIVDTLGNPQSPNGTCAHWGNETADEAFGWVPDDLVAQIETYYRAISFSELGTGSPRDLWDFLLAAAEADQPGTRPGRGRSSEDGLRPDLGAGAPAPFRHSSVNPRKPYREAHRRSPPPSAPQWSDPFPTTRKPSRPSLSGTPQSSLLRTRHRSQGSSSAS
jgi:hypothetical protein